MADLAGKGLNSLDSTFPLRQILPLCRSSFEGMLEEAITSCNSLALLPCSRAWPSIDLGMASAASSLLTATPPRVVGRQDEPQSGVQYSYRGTRPVLSLSWLAVSRGRLPGIWLPSDSRSDLKADSHCDCLAMPPLELELLPRHRWQYSQGRARAVVTAWGLLRSSRAARTILVF